MKIIFAGTPQFAASALAALLREHQIVAVLTQPDRPAGRGMQACRQPGEAARAAARLAGIAACHIENRRGAASIARWMPT